MNTTAGLVTALALSAALTVAQEKTTAPWRVEVPAMELTGNTRIDLVGLTHLSDGPVLEGDSVAGLPVPRKSPWLAAGMSAVLPGAGELYAENYYKSAAFFAVEVAAWVVAYSYDKKGNNQTNFFQNFADQHWSVVKYATYSLQLAPGTYAWQKTPVDPNAKPWDQVNWDVLNQMERDIGQTARGSYYSHVLPHHGDQQYYELIGKYEQFDEGWDDANPNLAPDYSNIVANLSPTMTNYSGMRAKANSYYNNASTAVAVAIINHLISAIDAAWTAASFNKSVHAEAGFLRVPFEDRLVDLPVLKVRVDL